MRSTRVTFLKIWIAAILLVFAGGAHAQDGSHSNVITVYDPSALEEPVDPALTEQPRSESFETPRASMESPGESPDTLPASPPPDFSRDPASASPARAAAPPVEITFPIEGAALTFLTTTLTGITSPHLSIALSDGKNTTTVTANAAGKWVYNVPKSWGWSNGQNISLIATNSQGGVDTRNFSIRIPPVVIESPSTDSAVSSRTPRITGTTDPGLAVTLASELNSTTIIADSSGRWSYTVPLSWGWKNTQKISLTATNPHGSKDTKIFLISIPPIFIAYPQDGSVVVTKTPQITGSTDPNLAVTVSDGTHAETVTADASGTWRFFIPESWEWYNGKKVLLTVTNALGGTAWTGFDLAVPLVKITSPPDGRQLMETTTKIEGSTQAGLPVTVTDGKTTVNVLADKKGLWSVAVGPEWGWTEGQTVTVRATNPNGGNDIKQYYIANPTVDITSPTQGAVLAFTTTNIIGTAQPNRNVTITDGINSAQVTSNGAGGWAYSVPASWGWKDGGQYTVSAILYNGHTSARRFAIAIPPVSILAPTNNTLLTFTKPTISGVTSPGLEVTVSDGKNSKTVSANPSGRWFCEIPESWGWQEGQQIQLTATNPNGGSDTKNYAIDIPTVVIQSPENGSVLTSLTPLISGSTSPGSVVKISDGTSAAKVTANSSGLWSYTVSPAWGWEDGHPVTVTAILPNGASHSKNYTINLPPHAFREPARAAPAPSFDPESH